MDNIQASVVGASVVSFLPGVPAQQRESVQLATLFAQRAALSAYKDGQVEDWYSYYKNQLKYFGWDATPADATYRPDPSRQRVVDQALEKISQVAGRPYAEASRRSLEALEKNGNALSLFESRSRNLDYAYFQLIPCSQGTSGVVDMVLYHETLNISEQSRGFLFQSSKTVSSARAELVRFNTRGFEHTHRDRALARLSSVLQKEILSLEL